MAKKADRRVMRTRRRLKEAVLELVRTVPYESITVQDIIDRADVGRSTFYAHFGSKEDLLLDGFRGLLMGLGRGETGAAAPEARERFGFSRPLLRHFRAQRRFFLATMVDGGNVRLRRMSERWLAERIRSELEETVGGAAPVPRGVPRGRPEGAHRADGSDAALDARSHGIAAAFLGVAAWWLDQGGGMAVEEADAIFREVVGAGADRSWPGRVTPPR